MLLNRVDLLLGQAERVTSRQDISDEAWAVMEPFFPRWKGVGRPIMDMRRTVEGTQGQPGVLSFAMGPRRLFNSCCLRG